MFQTSGKRVTSAQEEKSKKGGLTMKKIFVVLAIALLVTASNAALSFADTTSEYEVLVNELVKQGVLTPDQADSIKAKLVEAEKKAAEKKKVFELPKELEWLKRFKLTGDLRVRYQLNKDEDNNDQRHRGRYRFRLGLQAKVMDDLFVAAGLATGGTDPRSTNQTMANTFETPDIRFDYGYAQYDPFSWLTLKAGRIKGMPLWVPSDLLWDSDINPDGGAIQLDYTFLKNSVTVDGFFNTGFFILDDWSASSDPVMYYFQPGVKVKIKPVSVETAFTYYGFNRTKWQTLDHSGGSNTGWNTGLQYNYNTIALGGEVGLDTGFRYIPYVAGFGEYVYNPDPSDCGWLAGLKVGHKKVSQFGQWQAKYMYRYLQRDAWLDTFPDSDARGGATNTEGHEVAFEFGLHKYISVGLDYYYTMAVEHIPSDGEHLFQFDLQFKF
jgi:hypothetical protein